MDGELNSLRHAGHDMHDGELQRFQKAWSNSILKANEAVDSAQEAIIEAVHEAGDKSADGNGGGETQDSR